MPTKICSITILFIIGILFSSKLFSQQQNEISFEELKRIASPDKRVDAVLIRTNGGATTSFGNVVFLVLPGEKVKEDDLKYAVLNADHYNRIDIKWEASKRLLISYYKARIFSFTNFWESGEIDNWKYIVEIKLQCLSEKGQLFDQ